MKILFYTKSSYLIKNEFYFLKVVLFSFVFLLISLLAQSQQTDQQSQKNQISGMVLDAKGQPLPGASIILKGTSRAVITDVDGKFKLNNITPETNIIVVSFIGMKTQEILIKSKTNIEVRLEDALTGLDQIGVGYGSQKKASVVGAISNVTGADLVKAGLSCVANAKVTLNLMFKLY